MSTPNTSSGWLPFNPFTSADAARGASPAPRAPINASALELAEALFALDTVLVRWHLEDSGDGPQEGDAPPAIDPDPCHLTRALRILHGRAVRLAQDTDGVPGYALDAINNARRLLGHAPASPEGAW